MTICCTYVVPKIPLKMINVRTVLRKKQLSDGTYPVCLRVTKDRRSKYFKTIYNSFPKEWDERTGSFNKNHSNFIQDNRLLLKFRDRALKVIAELEMEKDDFSLREFEHNFRLAFNPVRRNVFDFWDEIVEELKLAGRMGNARFHNDTSKSVLRYLKFDKDLSFTDITPAFLEKYEAYLRSRGGTDGGIGVRMRSIRALYNHAIRRNIVKESLYPFRVYKVSRLKGRGAKRALTFEEVKQIINVDLSKNPELVNSKNYFVFSFYTRGMNFADMMKLKWKDVKGGNIYYTRSKTKGNFTIRILPPVQKILDYYRKNSLGTKYVFPILLHDELTPNQIENRKTKVLKNYNKDLKAIAELAEIEKSVTSYVARHSFANCLKQKGVATDVISESLGHQNMAITQAYLKELDTSVVDKAIEVLL